MRRDQYSGLSDVNNDNQTAPGNAVHLAPDARVPAQQPANPDEAAKVQSQKIAEQPSGIPSAPANETTTYPIRICFADDSRNNPTSQPAVTTARKEGEKNIMTPMIESLAVGGGFDEVMKQAASEW